MFEGTLGLFNTIGAVISVFLIIGIIVSKNGSSKISKEKDLKRAEHFSLHKDSSVEQAPQQKRWEHIAGLFHSQNASDWRVAVIDADSLLEACITDLGYQGQSFGEKLKSMNSGQVPALDAMWDVHRLRNTLAHNGSAYNLTHREAFRAYKIYENILRDFRYIA